MSERDRITIDITKEEREKLRGLLWKLMRAPETGEEEARSWVRLVNALDKSGSRKLRKKVECKTEA